MKLKADPKRNDRTQRLTSWRSASDPSSGNFSAGIDPQKLPQVVIWDGADPRWRSGPWDGRTFIGIDLKEETPAPVVGEGEAKRGRRSESLMVFRLLLQIDPKEETPAPVTGVCFAKTRDKEHKENHNNKDKGMLHFNLHKRVKASNDSSDGSSALNGDVKGAAAPELPLFGFSIYSVRAGGSGDEGKVARRKETNSWKIDFSGEKPATPLLDTINYPIHMKNLSTRAWQLWNEGTALELIDPALRGHYQQEQVQRCIHLGLLCVQEFPKDRPSMSSVVFMFEIHLRRERKPEEKTPATVVGEGEAKRGRRPKSFLILWLLLQIDLKEETPAPVIGEGAAKRGRRPKSFMVIRLLLQIDLKEETLAPVAGVCSA
ncbi:hypothetical protein AAC387_Pa07g0554 [Persea americana]